MDDDEFAMSYLQELISQIPFLNLLSSHKDPKEALNVIDDSNLHLVFLDINMPGITGIELARMLSQERGIDAPRIVFTTGFERFALESYKVDALDYLLKPIEYKDLIGAAYKVKTYLEERKKMLNFNYQEIGFIFLRVEYELVKVYLGDILYFEGCNDYVRVYLANADTYIKTLSTMKSINEKLSGNAFMRIHRSFIISLDKIDFITKQSVKIGKATIPISQQYKEEFKKFTDRWY
ncbi:LytR/AlgR family response regulator transcription factor [Mucilaginibacter sp. SP1R1]|uniref:LytR/AlgR family response regulator transcription factor n=1 Tax=Mucilaginibacter sp. SP1R1 TaxID=2723091 RepID=UPI0016096C61|nr:DNA-binding LytR/AlgR family response regulator [Mucilaginibacter sp. SP1R1]